MSDSLLSQEQEKKYRKIIVVLSIAIPVAVAALFGIKIDIGGRLAFLPPTYAAINGLTAVLLVWAVMAIKKGNRALHERLIKACLVCSSLFLLMYVAYHMTSGDTKFGGEGFIWYVYFFLLISHIALSVGIIPLVLFTYLHAWTGRFDKHKKMAKKVFPLWLYVAVTGVIIYFMISPYYPT